MLKTILGRSHIGSVKDNLRTLAEAVLRKVNVAGQHAEDVLVFVDKHGDVYAGRSGSGATAQALAKHEGCLVGIYTAATHKPRGAPCRQERRSMLPSVDHLAEDIGQHENSFAAVREFLAEAA